MKNFFERNIKTESHLLVYDSYSLCNGSDNIFPPKLLHDRIFYPSNESMHNIEIKKLLKILSAKSNNKNSSSSKKYVLATDIFATSAAPTPHLTIMQAYKTFSITTYGKTLYPLLAQTDFDKENDLMKFINTWGLPTGVEFDDNLTNSNMINHIIMDLEYFYKELEKYKSIFLNLAAYLGDNIVHPAIKNSTDSHMTHEETKAFLITKFNSLKPFSYKPHFTELDGTIYNAVFYDLFEIGYFFLIEAFNNRVKLRRCESCNKIFEVTHQRQRFCPPMPGRKRSSCEMKHNNILKQKRLQGGI
ncbi:hypothetical protein ATL39_1959 [Sinobaca qinghaiensis]|uniref:Uncharacterized protein n=1 Tax=Sinobaca qinghaiensis TaxID=342944 RepID=A0A419V552_9BACL|nr:hypothetical protein [Sinobaca qinghaiensis]RKD73657.1 hypothetical protein ATL39_1959 [Sinobaca qinghaiensis]